MMSSRGQVMIRSIHLPPRFADNPLLKEVSHFIFITSVITTEIFNVVCSDESFISRKRFFVLKCQLFMYGSYIGLK